MGKINLTNDQVYGLLILVIYSFFKTISHFILILNIFNLNEKLLKIYNSWWLLFSDIWNIIFIIFSIYLIFIKNIKNIILLICCLFLIFKGVLHFTIRYKIYKLFNIDNNTQQKIEKFHETFLNTSDLLIGLFSLFLLVKIYIIDINY